MGRILVTSCLSIFLLVITEATFIGFRGGLGGIFPIALPLPAIRPIPFLRRGSFRGRNFGSGGRNVNTVRVANIGSTRRRAVGNVGGGGQVIGGRPGTGVNEVVIIVNDRDCFGGICGTGGLGGRVIDGGVGAGRTGFGNGIVIGGGLNRYPDGGDASFIDYRDVDPGLGRGIGVDPALSTGSYRIHDADTVVIGGNGRI